MARKTGQAGQGEGSGGQGALRAKLPGGLPSTSSDWRQSLGTWGPQRELTWGLGRPSPGLLDQKLWA